jgi:DNA-directed RNA polymerase subunit M/transcription elongation factor TFIIS
METISKQLFMQRGLSSFDANVLSARLKYHNATFPVVTLSQKHLTSHVQNEWLDRVFRACASLENGGKGTEEDHELFSKTKHQNLLDEMKRDEDCVLELVSNMKKERTTGFMTCKNCRSTKVDVDQMQTRSADEPMTLFALCLDCGNRWTKK